MTTPIQPLPLPDIAQIESRQVLKKTANAHRYLVPERKACYFNRNFIPEAFCIGWGVSCEHRKC
jgi:hypothetical protein